MLNIEYKENLDDNINDMIDDEFNKFAAKNDVVCNYKSFNFVAKEDENIVGIITGHSYYNEVHISDLIGFRENHRLCLWFKKTYSFEQSNRKKNSPCSIM